MEMMLAQTGVNTDIMDTPQVTQIIDDLAPHLSGGKNEAIEVIAKIITDLGDKYDAKDIIKILGQQVEQLKKKGDQDQLLNIVKDLSSVLGSQAKAEETVKATIAELQGQQDEA